MNERSIRIRVPGTSANLGPGFDTLGIACTIYNELELILKAEPGLFMDITGEGADVIPRDEANIVWQAVRFILEKVGRSEEFKGGVIRMNNAIPLSRGLGSSAAAIVAGMKAANVLIGNHFSRRELLQFATEMEGHPDNVAPAIYGGFTVNVVKSGWAECFSFLPKVRLKLVVTVPEFTLSTQKSREILPKAVPLEDAIFNIGQASMLVAALSRGNEHFLRQSFDDMLHQKYRASLIPGLYDTIEAAQKCGAIGAVLSGAGPCIIAFTLERDRVADDVGRAMVHSFGAQGIASRYLKLGIDTRGAYIVNY